MTERDILDVLRSGDPAPLDTTPGPNSPLGRRIHAAVMANAANPSATPRHRRRLTAVLVAVATLAAGAGIAWALSTRSVTNPISVLCYDAPSTAANAIEAPRGPAPDTAACQALWDDGILPINSEVPQGRTPHLVACVTDTGTLAVFPTNNTSLCGELGLSDPAPLPADPDKTYELTQQLIDAINLSTCLTINDAQQTATDIINKLDVDNWTVHAQQTNPDRPCATLAIDEPNKTITLVPLPKTDGP